MQRSKSACPDRTEARFPKRIPAIQKSESEKEVPERFNVPIKGMTKSDSREIRIPWTKEPRRQPLIPPSALAKTPAEPPQKKWAVMPGTITGTRSVHCEALIPISRSITVRPPRKDMRKPIMTALGA